MLLRRARVGRYAVAAVTGIVVATIGGVGVANAATPAVTVTPSTMLTDMQSVSIAATGFTPNADVVAIECPAGAAIPNGCSGEPLGAQFLITDASGAFSFKAPVRRDIVVGSAARVVDCAKRSCTVTALNIDDFSEHASANVTFNPAVPPIIPTLTAVPATGLADHQLLTVTGAKFTPGSLLQLEQCASSSNCDGSTTRFVTTDANGGFTANAFPLERLMLGFTALGPTPTDCAAKSVHCFLTAIGDFANPAPKLPLAFDPNKPFATEGIAVSPSTGLHDLQQVTVVGLGFTPEVAVSAQECVGDPNNGECDFLDAQNVTPELHGEFALTFPVRRDVAPTFALPGTPPVNCATSAKLCTIAVADDLGNLEVAPLTFNTSSTLTTPTMTLSQFTNLAENQAVRVTLNGFAPARPIDVLECDAAAETGDFSRCDQTSLQTTSAPAGVVPVTSIAVHRVVSSIFGPTDCTKKAGACVLVAMPSQSSSGLIGGGVVLGGTAGALGGGATSAHSTGISGGGGTGVAGLLTGATIAGATPTANHLSAAAASRLKAITNAHTNLAAASATTPPGVAIVPLSFKP